jgi:hypothetical protein
MGRTGRYDRRRGERQRAYGHYQAQRVIHGRHMIYVTPMLGKTCVAVTIYGMLAL